MDSDKLHASVSNLELAEHKLINLSEELQMSENQKNTLEEIKKLIHLTVYDLRNFEVKLEIDSYSEADS